MVSSETVKAFWARTVTCPAASKAVISYTSGTERPRKRATTEKREPSPTGSGVSCSASATPGSHSPVLEKRLRYANASSAAAGTWMVRV